MFTAYPQHIHTILLPITLPQYTDFAFTYAILFTIWYFFTITAQLTLQHCLQLILNIYIRTVYNYTTQYTDFAFTYAILFTIWYFFTITAQLTLQQCLQHILNIYTRYCLQLHYPVYWLCFYICYPFHNMIFFHNYCRIDSATMFPSYPQHIHTVLFTITLPSILTLLFIYAFLFTMWYFLHITVQLSIWQCLHWIFDVTYCIV